MQRLPLFRISNNLCLNLHVSPHSSHTMLSPHLPPSPFTLPASFRHLPLGLKLLRVLEMLRTSERLSQQFQFNVGSLGLVSWVVEPGCALVSFAHSLFAWSFGWPEGWHPHPSPILPNNFHIFRWRSPFFPYIWRISGWGRLVMSGPGTENHARLAEEEQRNVTLTRTEEECRSIFENLEVKLERNGSLTGGKLEEHCPTFFLGVQVWYSASSCNGFGLGWRPKSFGSWRYS